jgi:hypothetical protein
MRASPESRPESRKNTQSLKDWYVMCRGWQEEWGGDLTLMEATLMEGLKPGKVPEDKEQIVKIAPMFNRAVLFRTSDISWHGMPDPVLCPEGQARKSLAIYYMSEARPEATPRFKAMFRPRPGSLSQSGLSQGLLPILPNACDTLILP